MAKAPHAADSEQSHVIHEFAPVARELLACGARSVLLQSPRATAIRQIIEDEMERAETQILSLDVFDTFLLRNDKPETARYHEWAQLARDRLLEAGPKVVPGVMDLMLARLRAMAFSYRTRKPVGGCREGHISQVHRVVCAMLGLEPECRSLLLQTELDYEASNLVLNPVLADAAAGFRAKGGRVVLVSDMYLGATEISALVDRVATDRNPGFDSIFSSADCIVSKRSGKVFPHIEAAMDARPSDFLHIGDAWEGDVVRPRQAGWRALHFPVARAESTRRRGALTAFIDEMRNEGHDLARWAQL